MKEKYVVVDDSGDIQRMPFGNETAIELTPKEAKDLQYQLPEGWKVERF